MYLCLGGKDLLKSLFFSCYGCCRSSNLVKIAHERGHEVLVGDCMSMPWRQGTFVSQLQNLPVACFSLTASLQDFVISIATIHHFTTRERRKEAVKVARVPLILHDLLPSSYKMQAIMRAAKPKDARLFIQVWALEQGSEGALSRRGPSLEPATLSHVDGEIDSKQDVFVPWTRMPANQDQKANSDSPVFRRYYHLFRQGELENLVHEAASELDLVQFDSSSAKRGYRVVDGGWEKGNWWIEIVLGSPSTAPAS
jgi:tRNA (uracil-5-)-methyltransferase TRM9